MTLCIVLFLAATSLTFGRLGAGQPQRLVSRPPRARPSSYWRHRVPPRCLLAAAAASACAARQPPSDAAQLTLSDELAATCRRASDTPHVQVCLDSVAHALDGGARTGAFNGLLIAPDTCWSARETWPAMRQLCDAVRATVEAGRRRVATELCADTLVMFRTAPELEGTTTYNVRIKLIEAHALSRECAYSAVQWSAYGMVEERDGGVRLVSDGVAHRLAASIRPHLDGLQRREP